MALACYPPRRERSVAANHMSRPPNHDRDKCSANSQSALLALLLTVTQEHTAAQGSEREGRQAILTALAPWRQRVALLHLPTSAMQWQVTTPTVANDVFPLDLALFSHTYTPVQTSPPPGAPPPLAVVWAAC